MQRGTRIGNVGWMLVIAAAAILPYLNALPNDFVWDDRPLILEDHHIRSARYLKEIFFRDFFSRSDDELKYGYYRPLVTLSYMADRALWGANPAGFRAANILLHAACALLVYGIARRLAAGRAGVAALAAILFAVHPIHTESVTWIAGRTDVICTLFYLLAFALHVSGRRILSLVPFALALLAKEMAMSLPAVVFLYEAAAARRPWRQALARALPSAVVAAAYFAWRGMIARVSYNPTGMTGDGIFALSLLKTMWLYVGKLVWPVGLSAYIQNPHVTVLVEPVVLASAALTAALAVVCVRLWRTKSALLFPVLAFGVSLGPLSNLIRISAPADMGFPMSERFLYLPSVFFLYLLADAWLRVRVHRAVLLACAAGLAGWWAAATVVRNRDWRDEGVFFRACVAQAPDSALLRASLGLHYARTGRFDEAADAMKNALYLNEQRTGFESTAVLNNLAAIHRLAGDCGEAVEILERLAGPAGGSAVSCFNLGDCYTKLGRLADARKVLSRALALRPDYPDALGAMGDLCEREGRFDEAAGFYRRALELVPDAPEVHLALGVALKKAGRLDDAERSYRKALALKADMAPAMSNLGVVLAMKGDLAGAEALLRQACAEDPELWDARNALGMVYAGQGRPADARREFESVLARAPDNVDALLNQGILAYQEGRMDAAQAWFEKAAKADPTDPRAASYLRQVRR